MPDLCLGFDTSAAHCAAALLLDGRIIASRTEEMSKGQAERLAPLLSELLAEAGHDWRDLALIGVGTGPGNFTGIRIAVSFARGLALSLGIPAIGVGAAEALAQGQPRPCRILIPARGDEVIWQDFGEIGPAVSGADALTGARTAPASAPRAELPPGPTPAASLTPIAEGIARLAQARLDRARLDMAPLDPTTPGQAALNLPRPAPIYLRPADAAPARDRGPVMLP